MVLSISFLTESVAFEETFLAYRKVFQDDVRDPLSEVFFTFTENEGKLSIAL